MDNEILKTYEILEKIGDVTPGDILHDANYIFNSGEKAVFILEN